MTAPRLVKPDDTESPENEKARIMLEKILDAKPRNLVFLWEDSDGATNWAQRDGSISAARGLIIDAADIFLESE